MFDARQVVKGIKNIDGLHRAGTGVFAFNGSELIDIRGHQHLKLEGSPLFAELPTSTKQNTPQPLIFATNIEGGLVLNSWSGRGHDVVKLKAKYHACSLFFEPRINVLALSTDQSLMVLKLESSRFSLICETPTRASLEIIGLKLNGRNYVIFTEDETGKRERWFLKGNRIIQDERGIPISKNLLLNWDHVQLALIDDHHHIKVREFLDDEQSHGPFDIESSPIKSIHINGKTFILTTTGRVYCLHLDEQVVSLSEIGTNAQKTGMTTDGQSLFISNHDSVFQIDARE